MDLLLLLAHTVQNLSLKPPSACVPLLCEGAPMVPLSMESFVESGTGSAGGGGGGGGGVPIRAALALARRGSVAIVSLFHEQQ